MKTKFFPKNKIFIVAIALLAANIAFSQKIERPKLVVGIVIDQMRWDYLYKFYENYGNDGFKRLLNNGFSCENTMLNYIPTYTAVGHASIYTGSVPSINGIVSNKLINQKTGNIEECVFDNSDTVKAIGINKDAEIGKRSPKNLQTTTITDELKLANPLSKVIGVALKDRAAILPAGHAADAAYWFEDSLGQWLTSTYYMKKESKWLQDFNKENTLKKILNSNEGNRITLKMAQTIIEKEDFGKDYITDFLAVSFSSPDYIGHNFSIDSEQMKNCYLNLDSVLSEFLKFLDKNVGKNNYLLFLTADHACAHNAKFLQNQKINSDIFDDVKILKTLNDSLKTIFGIDNIVKSLENYQVNFNYPNIKKIPHDELIAECIKFLENLPSVLYAVEQKKAAQAAIPQAVKECIINGYNRELSGEIQIIVKPAYYHGSDYYGSTHGTWYPYDSHIPLIFYGWKIKKGTTNREVYITDIAPTLAALLKIQMPNGCIGKPIFGKVEMINE